MSRNVLVTGSSQGIGAAIVEEFARQGYNVGITCWRHPEGGEKISALCRGYGVEAKVYPVDLSHREECESLMENFLSDFDTIDVLVNDAGGALKIPAGPFEDMPAEYWEQQINLNLLAAVHCSRAAVRNMKEHKIPGRIINISSIHGSLTFVRRKTLPYCAGKAGLEGFTRSLGCEVAKYGIIVNAVAPGFIRTPTSARFTEEEFEAYRRKIATGFLGETKHIVPIVMFLADVEKSAYIVGQTIHVDGGMSIDGILDCNVDAEI